MKLLLAVIALAALPFEIVQALHHLHGEPAKFTYGYLIGTFLTVAACGLALREIWHHFKYVKEPTSRETLSAILIVSGVTALAVAFIALYGSVIFFRMFVTWPMWCAACGVAALALGALIEVSSVYNPDLFAWANERDAKLESERRLKAAMKAEADAEAYYRKNPSKRPKPMPNVPSSHTKYVA